MIKLLRANMLRLRKNKLFGALLVIMAGLSVIMMIMNCKAELSWAELGYTDMMSFDKMYFNLTPLLGIFFAVMISMFTGTEYSDGTIRNKIIVGHSRSDIYLSNFITSIVSSFAVVAVWLLSGLVGLFLINEWYLPPKWVLIYILVILLLSSAMSAIFTLIGMLMSSKASSAVISIIVFVVMLVVSTTVSQALSAPEMISGYQLTSNGVEMTEPEPNPGYLRGVSRDIAEAAMDILPTGQGLNIANLSMTEPALPMIASTLITVFVTGIGMVIFKKKDLK